MITRSPGRAPIIAGALAVVGCVLVGGLFGSSQTPMLLAGIALVGMIAGVTVALTAPTVVYVMFAFVVGGIPFAVVPGIGPAILLLAVGIWATMLAHPITRMQTNAIEVAVALMLAVSMASVVMSAAGFVHVTEFIKWAIATSVIFPLMRLGRSEIRTVGVAYAWGATFGGGLSFFFFLFDKSGTLISYLSPIGYGVAGKGGTTLRFFEVGDTAIVRLTGTYVDPNAAGIFLFIGLALAIALMRGWVRIGAAAVISVALVVSLSRSALFSVAAAVVLYLLFQRLSTSGRLAVVLASVVGLVGLLAVPSVNARLFNSFGSGDKGTDDRQDALSNFIPSMSGHWWFGRGWGAKEFIDEVAGATTNFVANAPLVAIYRGGIVAGLSFVLVLVIGIVMAYRQCRVLPWESGVIGASFSGFVLIAMQLDFPVATNAAAIMAFTIFLVMLARNPVRSEPEPDRIEPIQKVSHGR